MLSEETPAEHLRQVQDLRAQIRGLESKIRQRRIQLVKRVVEAFNKESEPIDGMTTEARHIAIGSKPCALSPVGVCAYGDRIVPGRGGCITISLPAQRELAAHRKAHKETDSLTESSSSDACLFCGVSGEDRDYDNDV